MDISRFAGSLDEGTRAKLDALSRSDAAKALEGMFTDAELLNAASNGDEAAVKTVLRRVLSTDEGKKLAKMLGEAMK